jgi:hypothetical protein
MAKSMEVAQTAKVLSTRSFAAWHALAKALFDDYRPELHYMRGPGPKWREKYHWAEIGDPSSAVTRALMAGLLP